MTKYDKQWDRLYEQLVEYKRINGHCMVTCKYEQDKSLGRWVSDQRSYHNKNKLRPDRKELLYQIGFAWNARACAVRSSITDVRRLAI
jgi:hypothetical protein